jgi:hypothetical protein
MTTINGDFGFDAVFRKSAAELKLRLADDAADDRFPAGKPKIDLVAYSIFSGVGLISTVILAIGFFALQAEASEVWIHRLIALALMQSILIGAAAMKLSPLLERERVTINSAMLAQASTTPSVPQLRNELAAPPPLPAPPQPTIGGELAGREFLEYEDGSIEIDTLIGRRRFVSLEAAREFVGA